MKTTATDIPDVLKLEPRVFGDDRGFFFESFNARTFAEATGLDVVFVQDNHSRSAKGVLRGLHYQVDPAAQGKLVRVISGAIFDVAVDIRRGSPTLGRWVSAILSGENKHQFWLPRGFAHGFVALQDDTEIAYKTTDFYAPDCDRAIAWNDPDIGIDWPLDGAPVLSAKDASATDFKHADLFD
ncbi:MAG: dTDP-4-dehydrorhamnose 3,5-epimerase [Pseudomonadota bacterium]